MQISARRISKYAAKLTVGVAANLAITNAITATTDLDEDDLTVRVASGVGGWYVSERLETRTDALVDTVADRLPKRNRKTPETTETL